MKVTQTSIEEVLVIETDSFADERGYFYEAYSKNKYAAAGIDIDFVQDNVSKSVYGTIRGLHYQAGEYAQAKLCRVLKGKVVDVAVDVRFGSPTFGKHVAVELSEDNKKQFFIPTGFAHGFVVLSPEVIFNYKVGNYYNKESERTIRYDDPTLNIDWKVPNPIVSEKDKLGVNFSEIAEDFSYNK